MYAKYVYYPGVTVANILADIVAILTGETNAANLSAACNQASTTISAAVNAAGWTVHDASAGTNAKCIKSPLADNAGAYKYVVIDLGSAAGAIKAILYETWNASTHAGTNMAYNSNNTQYAQLYDTTNGGTVHISASARYLLLASLVGTSWGSPTSNGPCGVFERSRLCSYDTVAQGWPPYFWVNFGNTFYNSSGGAWHPRHMTRTGATVTANSAALSLYAYPWGLANAALTACSGSDQKVPDDSGGNTIPFWPLCVASSGDMPIPYGEISAMCDIYMLPGGIVSSGDIVQRNGNDYLCLRANLTSQSIAIRKG